MTDMAVEPRPQRVDVLIVGAGMSGIAAAIRLRRAGFHDLVVLEKAERLGGTWRDNTYPGAGCDVPALLYEYSFAPGPWVRTFATQPEILDYLEATAAAHGADEVIRYGVEVRGAAWNPGRARWQISTDSATTYTARALILATGPWHQPRYPELPGLDSFPGPLFHSARWDHTVELTGRTVAVIGNSASTVQFLPDLHSRAARVEIFQSIAPWILPKPDLPLPRALHQQAALRRLARAVNAWTQEAIGVTLRHPHLLPPLEAAARRYLHRQVPDLDKRKALTPHHRLGARRLLTSATYYPAVTSPHIHLHPTRAARIETGIIVGADGRRVAADAIILATGFQIGEVSLASHLQGADGQSLAQTWSGARHAYLGTSVSNYPNLFLLLGPNVLSGTTAVPTVLEAQLDYITDALTYLDQTGYTDLDIRPEIEKTHNEALQAALGTTVYATDPTSYYFSEPGTNTFCWPWSTPRLLRRLRTFDPDTYNFRTADGISIPIALPRHEPRTDQELQPPPADAASNTRIARPRLRNEPGGG